MAEQNWIFMRDGVEEKIKLERWIWGVVYKDDTEFHQFSDDGVFHQFKEINAAEVKLFVMYQPHGEGRYDIPVTEDMKIIHFYRNLRTPFTGGKFIRFYVFGYEKNINGKNHQTLMYIMPDDTVILADNDKINLLDFIATPAQEVE